MATWYEIRGVEPGATMPSLLMKFPQGESSYAEMQALCTEAVKRLELQGDTDLHWRIVEEAEMHSWQPEVLRPLLIAQIDTSLDRILLTSRERTMLNAMRGYVQAMTNDELTKFGGFVPQNFGDGGA